MTLLPSLLRHYRQRAGLTQKELAELINFHHTVISRTENPGSGYLPSESYLEVFRRKLSLSKDETRALQEAFNTANQHETSPTPEPMADLQTGPENIVRKDFRWLPTLGIVAGLIMFLLAGLFGISKWISAEKTDNPTEPPAASSNAVLYASNFSDGDISAWRSLNTGRWEIIYAENNPGLGVKDQPPGAVPNAYLLASDQWRDYAFSADVVFESGVYEQIYLVVRSAQEPNCSGYRIGGNRLSVSIFRFDQLPGSCSGELLAENNEHALISGQTYNLRAEVKGNQIRAFINNELVLSAQDAKYPSGGLGMLAYQVKTASFDNIRVTAAGQ